MRIAVISVSRTPSRWLQDELARYQRMLAPSWRLRFQVLKLSRFHGKDDNKAKLQDSRALLHSCGQSLGVVLDKSGKTFDSLSFSRWLIELAQQHYNVEIGFFVGGPLGFDENTLGAFPYKLSLSSLTLPHSLAQLLLVEQLFRAQAIIHNSGYHK